MADAKAEEPTQDQDQEPLPAPRPWKCVWTVHATLPNEVRPTEAVFGQERAACTHARLVSEDPGVLAASVARFTIDELGTRKSVAMFVEGKRQQVPYVSDCRTIHPNGRQT